MKTNIISTYQIDGLHCWPNAKKIIPKMEYLSDLHRHMFYFTAKKQVFHDDRDVEFIDFKRQLITYITKKYYDDQYECCNFKASSCEILAKELLIKFGLCYCSVMEDGENGGSVSID